MKVRCNANPVHGFLRCMWQRPLSFFSLKRCNGKGKYDRVGIFGNIWNSLSPYKPDICHKNDKMRLTALLRHTADTYPGHSASLHGIADKAEELVRKRYSVSRMIREMESFAHDADVLRLIVGTFKSVPVQPTLKMRDYKPYMALVACSPEDFAFCYLCNDLVAVYETEYRTPELMFFCDLLRCMRGRSYLNCVTNRVCDYFFRARRDTLRHISSPLKESEMQYAESRLKELEEAVFRLKVKMYKWHTFTAEELAGMCGMSYSHFRSRFEEYYGCSATDWLRQERISRIKEDLSYRPELALKEVAERNRFLSASNFSDFCNQQVLKTPGELKKEGYEEWCERRMKYWNSES